MFFTYPTPQVQRYLRSRICFWKVEAICTWLLRPSDDQFSGGLRNRLHLPVTNTHRRFRVNNEKGETRCVLAFRNSIMQGAGRSEHLYTSSRRLEHIMPDAFLFPILPIYPLLRSDSPTLCCADTTKAHAALPALWRMEATLFLRPSEPA